MRRAPVGRAPHVGVALALVASAWTSAAFAQEPPPAPPPVEGAPPAAEAQPEPAPIQEAPPPPPVVQRMPEPEPPTEKDDEPDLDTVKRPVGIGYAGLSQVPVGGAAGTLTAPAIGARIWVSPTTGIDVALGIGWTDGSNKVGSVETDLDAVYGFILQGGVPLALATHGHVSFQVIPYAAFAYGHSSTGSGGFGNPKIDLSGTRFELGARAGLEIFWGFIGLPQLSLSGTVGAAFEMLRLTSEGGGASQGQSSVAYGFSTTVQNNPWDIFTGNVAARYYF